MGRKERILDGASAGAIDWLLGEIEGGAGNDPFLLLSPPR